MKLVRDKIPKIIEDAGESNFYEITVCKTNDEFRSGLRDKLLEEARELFDEPSSVEEMADVLEVLYALAKQHGYSPRDIENARSRKLEERGGFEDGYLLEPIIQNS